MLGLERVELVTALGNVAAEQAAGRAGFVREGVLRSALPGVRGGPRRDGAVHALLAADVRQARGVRPHR